ncbi:hypothetical protein [Paenibacillus odorifer]|uniref:hypothetical protein n=1 Tax=Paenibacillus odorifer TaxID=189426 RepID=UPI00096E09C0|nr:hypothetical protein [Paenibacillus odorifer]OMD08213.1 hypothetical protein BJP47_30125 [Paenibacillus odorifer]
MSTKRRSPEERVAEIEKKMEQLKAKKQQLEEQVSQKERKERTRRLIQIGAIMESNFGLESLEEAEWVAEQVRDHAQVQLRSRREKQKAEADLQARIAARRSADETANA